MSPVLTCSLMLDVLFLAGVLLLSGVHAVVCKIQSWGQDRAEVYVTANYLARSRDQAHRAAATSNQVQLG